jgi:hypothetical protein
MDVVREVAKVPTDLNEKPRVPITVVACGLVEDEDGEQGEGQPHKLTKL